jgi:hypothetical protein
MSFSYDPSDQGVGTVRLMITDTTDVAPGPIFQDEELEAFLTLEEGSLRYAAAAALDCMAASQLLVQKQIKILDLETDGATLSTELRALAKQLRDSEENMAAFDIAEQVFDPFGARERIYKQFLRLRQ